MSNIQQAPDYLKKNFEDLSSQNHAQLPKDLQQIQNEKKQHTWEKNESKHLVHGQDFNIDDRGKKFPDSQGLLEANKHQTGDLNWNQSQNQPWNVLQNNTQSIAEDKTSIMQNQSRPVGLNDPKGVAVQHPDPQDNKGHKTREETNLKGTFGAPGIAPVKNVECGDKVTHGPAPGSQKQELSQKDIHREEERKNYEGLEYGTSGQKELVTKASKKNPGKDIQGPAFVEGYGHPGGTATIESKDQDFKSQTATDNSLKTGLEKAETDVIKENRATQDTAHGK